MSSPGPTASRGEEPEPIDEAALGALLESAFPGRALQRFTCSPIKARNSKVVRIEASWPDADARYVAKTEACDGTGREAIVHRAMAKAGLLGRTACLATEGAWILLEDLESSHRAAVSRAELLEGRGVPERWALDAIVEALAELHAAAWEIPALGREPFEVRDWIRDEECHAKHVARRRRELDAFVAIANPDAALRNQLEEGLALLPHLWETRLRDRVAGRRGLTLTHGDAYLNQFLVPRWGPGPARLLDFGDASANLGPYDLAYLLATFWTPDQRAEHEARQLGRYAEALAARGVAGEWVEAVRDDYRISIAYLLFDPVFNVADGSSRAYWEPKLGCLSAAWRDQRCAEL